MSSSSPRRVPSTLGPLPSAAAVVVLTVAVFVAPAPLASVWPGGGYRDVATLRGSLSSAFVRYWDVGTGLLGPDLARPVDYWGRFHVVKAVLAGMLLVVLVMVARRIWTRSMGAEGTWRRLRIGAAGAMVASWGFVALLMLVANVQGAVAPWSSALGLMPLQAPDPTLAATLEQVRHGLSTGDGSPALSALVHDFVVYHAVMAVLAVVVAVGLCGTGVLLWRRRSQTPRTARRPRRLLATASLGFMVLTASFGVIAVANVSTVAHPAPALLGFFEGGR